MRRISITTRDELVKAATERYAQGDRTEKSRILDELMSVSGYHRKHAMRLLRDGSPRQRSEPRPEQLLYDNAVREALIVLIDAPHWIGKSDVVPEFERLLQKQITIPAAAVFARCAVAVTG